MVAKTPLLSYGSHFFCRKFEPSNARQTAEGSPQGELASQMLNLEFGMASPGEYALEERSVPLAPSRITPLLSKSLPQFR